MSYPTSFHTLVLILTSESSRLKLNLLQAMSSWRLRNKSPFYLKCLVLTNQNQLGFQTIVTAMDSQNSEKSKITMSLFYAVSTLLLKQKILLIWGWWGEEKKDS